MRSHGIVSHVLFGCAGAIATYVVMAGALVMRAAGERGIRPVDSEHSAIWQCLWGESRESVRRLIITASGGPFAANAIATTGLFKATDMMQELFIGPVFDPVLKALGTDRIKFRASLCASALIGLGIMRYTVRSEPIRSMDVETLVDAIAPTLQRYMVGDIS